MSDEEERERHDAVDAGSDLCCILDALETPCLLSAYATPLVSLAVIRHHRRVTLPRAR